MLLVQTSILICAIYALVSAFRAHGAALLFKILIVANILICLNTEIYRDIVLFWATVSAPIALYLIFLYLLSKLMLFIWQTEKIPNSFKFYPPPLAIFAALSSFVKISFM